MTPEILSAVAGSVLSLGFTYIPKLNTRYAAMDEQQKKLIMLLLLLGVSVGIFGLGCADIALPVVGMVECTRQGAIDMVGYLVLAISANQGTHRISPEPKSVQVAKTEGD